MLTLKGFEGKPFLVFPDIQLNTRTGTVLISDEICSGSISWPDCSSDIFELIAEEHDITHTSCFIINPRGHRWYPANFAKLTFKGQDLPDSVYICDARGI